MERVFTQNELTAIILGLLRKYHAEHAILFGSYARNDAETTSDIDLVVVGGDAFDPTDTFSLAEELHRETGKEVDVYELCEINQDSDFFRTIMKEGVRIAA